MYVCNNLSAVGQVLKMEKKYGTHNKKIVKLYNMQEYTKRRNFSLQYMQSNVPDI